MNRAGKKLSMTRSKALYEKAKESTPGGVHSNVRWRDPHPLYFAKAKGSAIWDCDGNRYIDCVTNYGALILGHGDPDVRRAVEHQLKTGLTAGVETELSIQVAEKMIQMIPCADMVRFANSGTEAVMHAIQIARGYTKKERIIKAEGNYHGWYDYVYCSHRYPKEDWQTPRPVPASEGLSKDLFQKTLVVPWNDLDEMEKTINRFKDEIAAVILEPANHNIGCALPRQGYLEGVRELTSKSDIVLIFDEVITGFRAAPGGAQAFFGVTPDLATFGKAIANGFPLSAVAGKRQVMEVITPTQHNVSYGGTYNGNQVVLAAASVVLDKLATGEVQKNLNRLNDKLVDGFSSMAEGCNVKARMKGLGGRFQVYFGVEDVVDWRTAFGVDRDMYVKFRDGMAEGGILWATNCFSHNGITVAHTDRDIDTILATCRAVLEQLGRG